jgi:glycosyltransferase involved in cell wall biosynthesis
MEQIELLHLFLPNVWSHYVDVGLPRVTTVHDLSHVRCPETMPADNIATLSAGLQAAVSGGSEFIAVSDFTRGEMSEVYGVDADRLWVTLEGGDERRFFPETRGADIQRVRSTYGLPETPFLLALGTLEPRKNLMRTVRAFERVAAKFPDQGISFVIAGHTGWGSTREWKELEASPRVRAIGHVAEGDLAGLYSEAAAFCYVSHYEGFGLPPLEAMSCGTPVIYGDCSAMPEVVGRAGLRAAPHDEAAIAEAIERLVRDTALRDSLECEAVMRARAFTWKRVAERTLQVYAHAIEQGVRPSARNGSTLGRVRATASRLVGRAER